MRQIIADGYVGGNIKTFDHAGETLVSFSFANYMSKDKSEWIDVVIPAKNEFLNNLAYNQINKGVHVTVVGYPQIKAYTKNGVTKSYLSISAEKITVIPALNMQDPTQRDKAIKQLEELGFSITHPKYNASAPLVDKSTQGTVVEAPAPAKVIPPVNEVVHNEPETQVDNQQDSNIADSSPEQQQVEPF